MDIDFKSVVPAEKILYQHKWRLDGKNEQEEAKKMLSNAAAWLAEFRWVRQIKSTFVGYAIPGVVGIFCSRLIQQEMI